MANGLKLDLKNADSILSYLAAIIISKLSPQHIGKNVAELVATDIVEEFTSAVGGRQIYLPKGRIERAAAKHDEMYELYRAGETIGAIAQAYGTTEINVYRIISKVKAARRANSKP